MTTLACPLDGPRRPGTTRTSSRSCATVDGYALYFSRSPIPHARRRRAASTAAAPPRPLRVHARDRAAVPDPRADAARAPGAPRAAAGARARDPRSASATPTARCSRSTRPRTSSGRTELAARASPMTAVRITDERRGRRRPAAARARRPVRDRGARRSCSRIAETIKGICDRHGVGPRLQVVVRQGQPLVRRDRPAARAWRTGWRCSPRSRTSSASRSSPTSTRAGRPKPAAEVADVLQIPAFLCRQTDLLVAAARDRAGGEREEGPVPLAAGDGQRRREARGGGLRPHPPHRARHDLRLQRPRRRLPRLPQMPRLGYRSSSTRRTACSSRGARRRARAGQREYVPHLARAAAAPSASTGCSSRCTTTGLAPRATGRTWSRRTRSTAAADVVAVRDAALARH